MLYRNSWLSQLFLCVLCSICFAFAARAADVNMLNPSGLPIPRFVSLKSSEVNMRIGPGTSYPIRWVYHKRHLPVKIIEEFGNWRKVRDHEGEDGWIHRSLLSGHRTALVRAETIAFHLHPSAESPVIMQAKQNVLGHLQQCTLDWCRLDIQNIRGWAKKSELWGVFGEEIIEE